ncbi:glucose PTS transporter subunit EIIB [Streptomyces sp. NPDC050161]|uniref:glucose PTS transporter subunit EIIB n=1 Tax=Streptomyces sp. NPDC050161 TaxID=3365604 RepID=UPI0037AC5B5C
MPWKALAAQVLRGAAAAPELIRHLPAGRPSPRRPRRAAYWWCRPVVVRFRAPGVHSGCSPSFARRRANAHKTGLNVRYGSSTARQNRRRPRQAGVDMASKAEKIVAGLGGLDNIEEVEGCITRLRTEVVDASLVDEAALKAAGAHGVVKMGTAIQVVIGTDADPIAADIEDMM